MRLLWAALFASLLVAGSIGYKIAHALSYAPPVPAVAEAALTPDDLLRTDFTMPSLASTDEKPFDIGAWRAKPRKAYTLTARVYGVLPLGQPGMGGKQFDKAQGIMVGWGPLSAYHLTGHPLLQATAGGVMVRFPRDGAIAQADMRGNMALIDTLPADAQAEQALKSLQPGDVVRIGGLLIDLAYVCPLSHQEMPTFGTISHAKGGGLVWVTAVDVQHAAPTAVP